MNAIKVDKEVIETLVKTKDLLEELLETIDVLADEEIMNAIKESEEEIKRGETRDFKNYKRGGMMDVDVIKEGVKIMIEQDKLNNEL